MQSPLYIHAPVAVVASSPEAGLASVGAWAGVDVPAEHPANAPQVTIESIATWSSIGEIVANVESKYLVADRGGAIYHSRTRRSNGGVGPAAALETRARGR